MSIRENVERYLGECRAPGTFSCGVLGRIRRQPRKLAELFEIQADERAIALLRRLPRPDPTIRDDVGLWLDVRLMAALHAAGIDTLADRTVRVAWAGGCAAHRGILCAVVPWEQLRRSNEVGSSQ
ncbi:phage integrase family protein [Ralstonia pseudosolanacearum]